MMTSSIVAPLPGLVAGLAALPAPTWQERAVAAYGRAGRRDPASLRSDLIARVAHLIGRRLAPEQVAVNARSGLATAVVDGVRFGVQWGDLVVLRPCARCGEFVASPAIAHQAHLGYALSAWQPRCARSAPPDHGEVW